MGTKEGAAKRVDAWTEAEDRILLKHLKARDFDPASTQRLYRKDSGKTRTVAALYTHILHRWPELRGKLDAFRATAALEKAAHAKTDVPVPEGVATIGSGEAHERYHVTAWWLSCHAARNLIRRWGRQRAWHYSVEDIERVLAGTAKPVEAPPVAGKGAPVPVPPSPAPTVSPGAGKAPNGAQEAAGTAAPGGRCAWSATEHRLLRELLATCGTRPKEVQRKLAGLTGNLRTLSSLYGRAHAHLSERSFPPPVRKAFLAAMTEERTEFWKRTAREARLADPPAPPAPPDPAPTGGDIEVVLPQEALVQLARSIQSLVEGRTSAITLANGSHIVIIRRVRPAAWTVLPS